MDVKHPVMVQILEKLDHDFEWDENNPMEKIYSSIKDEDGQPLKRYSLCGVKQFTQSRTFEQSSDTVGKVHSKL